MTVCPECGIPHHTDCWNENGGCTVWGCRAAPKPTIEPTVDEPTPYEPAVVERSFPVSGARPTDRRPARFAGWRIAVSLVVFGVAVSIALRVGSAAAVWILVFAGVSLYQWVRRD